MAVNPAQDPVLHLLRRATYGPTPALAAEVRKAGTTAWLDAQLAHVPRVPDPAMDALARRYPRQGLAIWQARHGPAAGRQPLGVPGAVVGPAGRGPAEGVTPCRP